MATPRATWTPYTYNPYATIPGVPDQATAVTPAQLKRQLDAVHVQMNQVYYDLNQSNTYNVEIINEASAESPTYGNTNKLLIDNKTDQTTTAAIDTTVTSDADLHSFLNKKGEWLRGLPYRTATAGYPYAGLVKTDNTVVQWPSSATGAVSRSLMFLRGDGTFNHPIPPTGQPNQVLVGDNADGAKWSSPGNSTQYLRGDGTWQVPPYLAKGNGSTWTHAWEYSAGALGTLRLEVIGSASPNTRGNATLTAHDGTCPGLYLEPTPGTNAVYFASASSNTRTASRSTSTAALCDHAAGNVRLGLPYKELETKRAHGTTRSLADIDLTKIKTMGHELDPYSLIEAGFDVDITKYDINSNDKTGQSPAVYEDEITYGVADILGFLIHKIQEQQHHINLLKEAYNTFIVEEE